jgi:hypothetical protein
VENSCQVPTDAQSGVTCTNENKNKVQKYGTIHPLKLLF